MNRRTFLGIAAALIGASAVPFGWLFRRKARRAPLTLVWTGVANDGDFSNPENWDPHFKPMEGDSIVVPAGHHCPSYDMGAQALDTVTIEAGASIGEIAGFDCLCDRA